MTISVDKEDAEFVPLLAFSESSPTSRKGTRYCQSRYRQYVVGFLLIALISTASLAYLASFPSLNLQEFPPDGPGIGIALSTDYNTISIHQDDGTVTTVAKIPATKEYAELLRRLSLPSSQHPSPPYNSLSESMRDRPRQWWRTLRKKAGFPASSDVGIIVQTIDQLIAAAEHFLPPSQLPLSSALVVLPLTIALYPEDAKDALEYLGLQPLRGHNVYTVLRALPAAYAGYGLGLCAHPSDFELCLEEEQKMSKRGVIAVDINSASISIDAQGMDTPMYVFVKEEVLLDWRGGLLPGEPDEIWDRIRGDIRYGVESLVRRSSKGKGEKFVDDVLMIGEKGGDDRLATIVREIVAEVQEEEATIWSEQPQFVVAEGAAELAKRLLLQRGRMP
jgi:hypothetical protein